MQLLRYLFVMVLCCCAGAQPAQVYAQSKTTNSTAKKSSAPAQKKQTSTAKKSTSSASKNTKTNTSGKGKQSGKSSAKKQSKPAATTPTRSKSEVQSAKKRNSEIQQETRKKIALNTKETEKRLNQLNLLGGEIVDCNADIASLSAKVDTLNAEIQTANDSIAALDAHMKAITDRYTASLRKAQGNRSNMSDMAFIFSSESFATAYRRARALKQFGKWRQVKAEEIKEIRTQLDERRTQLALMKAQLSESLHKIDVQRATLERKQAETNNIVAQLKKEGNELQQIMARQRREAAALDAELDRIIAEEVRRAEEERRRKAEAEARAKAEAAERERKAREAEQARLKAEAEAKAKAEAEARAKAEAAAREAEQKKSDKEAQRRAKDAAAAQKKAEAEAKKAREAAEKQARESAKKDAEARKASGGVPTLRTVTGTGESGVASADVSTASSFAKMRGSLPFPVAGRYTIIKRFGRQPHPTLPHVETTNSGIDMETVSGASVRSVFDGEVSAVFRPDGYNNVVVIRHGEYTTVYANLGSISVSSGDKVKAGQSIGTVFTDSNDHNRSILHFEVRHLRQKEDPEVWLKK